jgi:hypothetical protein
MVHTAGVRINAMLERGNRASSSLLNNGCFLEAF